MRSYSQLLAELEEKQKDIEATQKRLQEAQNELEKLEKLEKARLEKMAEWVKKFLPGGKDES
jgi:predicted  nucleic acid-binding Zn-ribbon protein